MACFEGILDRCEWWSYLPVNQFDGTPFWLGKYISLQHFEDIMQGLWYTNHPWPDYEDCFHDVCEMIDKSTTNTKTIIILAGCCVWMNQRLVGLINTVPVGWVFYRSLTCLGMNTTQSVMVI